MKLGTKRKQPESFSNEGVALPTLGEYDADAYDDEPMQKKGANKKDIKQTTGKPNKASQHGKQPIQVQDANVERKQGPGGDKTKQGATPAAPKAKWQQHQSELSKREKETAGAKSDPSLTYLRAPMSAPIVREATTYFKNLGLDYYLTKSAAKSALTNPSPTLYDTDERPLLKVVMGPPSGWRTLAKLAVRTATPGQTTQAQTNANQKKGMTDKDESSSSSSSSSSESSGSGSDSDSDNGSGSSRSSSSSDDEGGDKSTSSAPQNATATPTTNGAGKGGQGNQMIGNATKGKRLSRREKKIQRGLAYIPPRIGLFKPGTHDIVPGIVSCPAHHPSINTAVQEITAAVKLAKVQGYDDTNGSGQLRYIAMAVCSQASHPLTPDNVASVRREVESSLSTQNKSLDNDVARALGECSQSDRGKIQLTIVWNSGAKSNADKPKSFDTPKIAEALPAGAPGLERIMQEDPALGQFVKELLKDRRKIIKKNPGIKPQSQEQGGGAKNGEKKDGVEGDKSDRNDEKGDDNDDGPAKKKMKKENGEAVANKAGAMKGKSGESKVQGKTQSKETGDGKDGESDGLLPSSHWLWHSLWINYQLSWSHTSAIFSHDPNAWQRIYGPPAIVESMPVSNPPPLTLAQPPLNQLIQLEEQAKQQQQQQLNNKKGKGSNAYMPRLLFPPQVFRQANMAGFARIIGAVRPFIPDQARIVELYGGVGTIGLNLIDKLQYLVCSDENPYNEACFNAAVAALPPHIRHNKALKYIPRGALQMVNEDCLTTSLVTSKDLYTAPPDALDKVNKDSQKKAGKGGKEKEGEKEKKGEGEKATGVKKEPVEDDDPMAFLKSLNSKSKPRIEFEAPNVVIVDPPRKGLEPGVVDKFSVPRSKKDVAQGKGVQTLVYVSCGFKALRNDLDKLVKGTGGWKIAHVEGHLLIPGADHIETLVILKR